MRSIWLEFASGDMAPVSPTKAAIARLIEELGRAQGLRDRGADRRRDQGR